MNSTKIAVLSLCVFLCTTVTARAEELAVFAKPKLNHLKIPRRVKLGGTTGVAADSRGGVYLLHRGSNPVLYFDETGKFVRSLGDKYVGEGHGINVDRDDNVWVACIKHHAVFKFSPDGRLLLALGQPHKPGSGTDPPQFNKPTHVAFGPAGEVYVTDGYGNSRIMKFSAEGRFLKTWGEAGNLPGRFNAPHCAVIDEQGRVLICDRDNHRIQIFDSEGRLLDIWTGYVPYSLTIDAQGKYFVADGDAGRILQINRQGRVLQAWGRSGDGPGEFQKPHMLTTDPSGNVFVAEVDGKRAQMLVRK